MLRLRIKELLEEQGHTKYWLYKQMGLSYQNLNKVIENQTTQIRFDTIERLVEILGCDIGELFEYEKDDEQEEL
ncbi:MAG: helix-turn-helix transcriptional regulator [Lachnospiraceae bacterium]|nr:helix-turn-helix transcriptional regulator [Lachnospiraceae bacterium]